MNLVHHSFRSLTKLTRLSAAPSAKFSTVSRVALGKPNPFVKPSHYKLATTAQEATVGQQTASPSSLPSLPFGLSWGKLTLGGLASLLLGASLAQSQDTSADTHEATQPPVEAPADIPAPMRERMTKMVRDVQDKITSAISEIDGTPFREDTWQREGGGGGWTRVLQDGNVFEKAGVNVSVVYGTMAPAAVREMNSRGKNLDSIGPLPFFAVGVSLVIHPHNPMVPTVHCNYRYFETVDKEGKPTSWWFGGGADLTPSYLFEEDAVHFHQVHKDACDKTDPSFYPRFKKWCDDYFRITHRNESRGIGGIFFDDLADRDPDTLFDFAKNCANAFVDAYVPIVLRRKDLPFTPEQKLWQQLRRGRYVEFNLVYDRGTKFGLHSNGRIESILMSLPLTARWMYDHRPEPGSEEDKLWQVLRNPRDWIPLEENKGAEDQKQE